MNITEVNGIWEKVKEGLKENLPEHIFGLWINPIEAVDYDNNNLVLLTPHPLAIEMLKKSWFPTIKDVVKKTLGDDATFSLNYDSDIATKYVERKKQELRKQIAGLSEQEKQAKKATQTLAQMQSSANLNLNLKFDNFVVGENSKFAYNASYAVANNPAKKFNPLFIYGESGLGKTHLMQAIGHYIIFNKPELKVRYVRMEEYFTEWVQCFQHGDANSKKGCNNSLMRKFHQKFQNVDVLLMDDIQFIEGKMKTMEDFFSVFEALYTNNKQIVIASDKLPSDIPTLDNRLKTRFQMGLVVNIVPPDLKTRFEIVKAFSKEFENTDVEEDVFQLIAENFVSDVRALKGAYNKVYGYSEIFGAPLTLETAQKALSNDLKRDNITVDTVAKVVAKRYSITLKDLKSTARQQKIANARHIAIYLSREMLSLSYEAIAKYFDKKHPTIMYSCDLISDKLKSGNNSELQQEIEAIKTIIRS